jgi:hypothetical protein
VTTPEGPISGTSGHPDGDGSKEPSVLTVALTGDRVMVENVILEVRALAQKFGLEIPDVTVICQPTIAPKKPILPLDPVGDTEGNGSERV